MDEITFQIKSLSLSEEDQDEMIIYLSHLASQENINYFKLSWPAILIENCDESGKLLNLWNTDEVQSSKLAPWLLLPLKMFKVQVIFLQRNFYIF